MNDNEILKALFKDKNKPPVFILEPISEEEMAEQTLSDQPIFRIVDTGEQLPPITLIYNGKICKLLDENGLPYSFFVPDWTPPPPTRYQRFKNRIRKAFWFLFRDEE